MREDLGPLFLWTKNLARSKIRILEEPQIDQETYQLQVSLEVCSMVNPVRNPRQEEEEHISWYLLYGKHTEEPPSH